MTTVYISIGTPKTGTTALQSFMRENEERMKQQGYCYPLMRLGISGIYKNRNAQFLIYRTSKGSQQERKEQEVQVRAKGYAILEELARKYPNIVLSDEQIWYRCNQIENFWPDLLENFRKINCRVKVIVYLRRQDQVIQSLWNQLVKMFRKMTKDFKSTLEDHEFDYFPLDYYKQLEEITKYVKKEDLIVRPFERGQFEGEEHSIFSDFFGNIGLKLNDEFTHDTVAKNVGLEGNYIEIKRILNEIPEYRVMNDFMCRPILNASTFESRAGRIGKSSMFTFEEQKAFVKKYEESNRKVAMEYLGREDGVLFFEPVKELPVWEVNQDTMYRDILVSVGELFCAQEKRIQELEKEVKALRTSLIFRIYWKMRRIFKGDK